MLWELAADDGRADPPSAAAAKHAGRGVPEGRRRNQLDADLRPGLSALERASCRATPGAGWRSPGRACAAGSRIGSSALLLMVSLVAGAGAGRRSCAFGDCSSRDPSDRCRSSNRCASSPRSIAPIRSTTGSTIWTIAYSFFFKVEIFFIMLLVLIVGPNLISQDLRFNALPLYFSRPLTADRLFPRQARRDRRVCRRWWSIVPAVVAYVLGVCFQPRPGRFSATRWRCCSAASPTALVIVVSAGTLMLALSSLSRRSLYVAHCLAGVFMWSRQHCDGPRWRGPRAAPACRLSAGLRVSAALDAAGSGYDAGGNRAMAGSRAISAARACSGRTRELEAAPTNWRPLCLLHRQPDVGVRRTDAAGRPTAVLGKRWRGCSAARTFASGFCSTDRWLSQYPWNWSAGVLAGLLGLSLCTLTPIKSLDRLQVTPVVEFHGVSKWYGNVIGLNKLTVRIPAGVTGLLGPNGAGKSTLLQLATGQLRPSQGSVRVLGQQVWNNPALDAHDRPLPRAGRLLRMDDGLGLRRTCAG